MVVPAGWMSFVGGTLEWIERRVVQGGVVEQSFRLGRAASTVPGVLWLPPSPVSAPPLVLLGHGGSGPFSIGWQTIGGPPYLRSGL